MRTRPGSVNRSENNSGQDYTVHNLISFFKLFNSEQKCVFLFTLVNLLKGENFFSHFFEPPLNEKVTFFVLGYSRKKRMEK